MSKRIDRMMVAAALVLAGAAAPAAAQYNPYGNATAMSMESFGRTMSQGSVGPFRPDQDTVQSLSLYNQMITYGRCTVSTSKGLARQALATAPDNATERFLFTDIEARGQACKGTGLTPIRMLVRGVYAEGLYHASAKKAVPAALQPTDPAYAAFMAGEEQHNATLGAGDRGMAAATNCLAAQQPTLVHDVLAAKHGSTEEAQGMDKLFAAAPACAGPSRPAALNRSFLRAFLAISAYRYWLSRDGAAQG